MGALATTVVAVPGQAEEVRLTPANDSAWVLDFADEKCRLGRHFGGEGNRHLVLFEQFAPGTKVFLTVAGDETGRYAGRDHVELTLNPVFSGRTVRTSSISYGDYRSALFVDSLIIAAEEENADDGGAGVNGLPHIAVDAIVSRGELSLRRGGDSVVFELPGLKSALTALNDCSRDLIGSWGLDTEVHDTMSRQAEPINFQEIADRVAREYPRKALRDREQASLAMRIIVDADGSIEQCVISEITSAHHLGTPICDEFGNRAMFAPAEDAEGQPIKSYYATTIIYRIN